MKIIFIAFTNHKINVFNDRSVLYRCLFIAKEIEKHGHQVTIINDDIFFSNLILDYDAYIFFRPNNKNIRNFDFIINLLKEKNKLLFTSYDDLIFSKKMAKHAPSIVNGQSKIKEIESYFFQNQLTTQYFSNAIVSTEVLKEELIKVAPEMRVYVINNFIPDFIYNTVDNNLYTKKRNFHIGYMCGTSSHNIDFKLVEDVLIKFALDYPKKRIIIAGPLAIETDLFKLTNVYKYNIVGYERMFYFLALCNYVISPLINNTFNQAKSNIKFLESQVTYTRLIVQSDITEFSKIPKNLLDEADTKNDWYNFFNRDIDYSNNISFIKDINSYRSYLETQTLAQVNSLLNSFK